MKWISVKDGIPEAYKHVAGLSYEDGFAYYYAGEFDEQGDFGTNDQNIADITHWCYWPELP